MAGRASPPRLLSSLRMHFPSTSTNDISANNNMNEDRSLEVEEGSMNDTSSLRRRSSSPPLPPLSYNTTSFPPVLAPPAAPAAVPSAPSCSSSSSSSLLSAPDSAPTTLPTLALVESPTTLPMLSSPASATSAASADESHNAVVGLTSPLALPRVAGDNDDNGDSQANGT